MTLTLIYVPQKVEAICEPNPCSCTADMEACEARCGDQLDTMQEQMHAQEKETAHRSRAREEELTQAHSHNNNLQAQYQDASGFNTQLQVLKERKNVLWFQRQNAIYIGVQRR